MEAADEPERRARLLEAAKRTAMLESRRYLSEVGLLENLDKVYSMPVARYVLCSSMAVPVKVVIVAERPYSTDIHPQISSAMSYDRNKARPTPSSIGMASDVSRVTGCKYVEVEEWVRNSWKFLSSGIMVVNCTLFASYSSSSSIVEVVAFQRWLRRILELSTALSPAKVDVLCMGVPAQNTVDSMIRSMGKQRYSLRKKTYPNPAIWSRLGGSDAGSREYTFNKKGTSESILSAIRVSKEKAPLSYSDFYAEMSKQGPQQLVELPRLLEKSKTLVDEFESAYKDMDPNHRHPSMKDAYEGFSKALIAYRDSVLYDIVRASMSTEADDSRIGRNAEWGNKSQWKKPASSVGNSTRMSTVSEDTGGVDVKFDDGEDVKIVESDTEKEGGALKQPLPKKKTKIIKRPKGSSSRSSGGPSSDPSGDIRKGQELTQRQAGVLRNCLYYVSEINSPKSAALQEDLRNSGTSNTVETDVLGIVLKAAAKDLLEKDMDSSVSLGLEDGSPDDTSHLVLVLKRIIAA